MKMPVTGALAVSAYKYSNIMAGDWRGERNCERPYSNCVWKKRHREEFQVEVAAMFREISVTFSESSAFLSLCSVL